MDGSVDVRVRRHPHQQLETFQDVEIPACGAVPFVHFYPPQRILESGWWIACVSLTGAAAAYHASVRFGVKVTSLPPSCTSLAA